jgi:acetyl-CoA acyltransferase 2
MKNVYLLDGARTPFGGFGQSLSAVSTTTLGAITAGEALKRATIKPEEVDQVFYGNVIHTSTNAAYVARHIAIHTGIPVETPAMLVNRLCGSGLQAVVSAAQSMILGEGSVALAGGVENMSLSPHVSFESRLKPQKFGELRFDDMLEKTLSDEAIGSGMGITAENLAQKYELGRDEQDEFALLSHTRAAAAIESCRFAQEIVPVTIESRRGNVCVSEDEHVKKNSSLEKLGRLRPAFKKDGTVTAGNSSGINDGAVSLVLATEERISSLEKEPLAKLVSWGIAGVDPNIMGIGPVPAIKLALQRASLELKDIDLIEVNEAFAAQYIAVEKELGLDRERTNVNGGAIALGHPVGASGARVLLTLAYELRDRNAKYGLASLCIGGGQGIAMVIENCAKS